MAATISIDNIYCKISGIDKDIIKIIDENLSYFQQGFFFY